MLLSYLRLVLFAIGLLVGVQVPGFINDYAKRVEAHLIEAQTGLRGFDATAQQFFNGDLQALVAHYRASDDPVFRSDADSLSTLLDRQVALDKQFQAMQGPWYIRALQVAVAADPDDSPGNLERLQLPDPADPRSHGLGPGRGDAVVVRYRMPVPADRLGGVGRQAPAPEPSDRRAGPEGPLMWKGVCPSASQLSARTSNRSPQ